MAIDFGRMFRNVATGYLSAKIANTEANDALEFESVEISECAAFCCCIHISA